MRVCQFRHFGINVAPDLTRRCDGKYSSILKGLLNVSNPRAASNAPPSVPAIIRVNQRVGICKSVLSVGISGKNLGGKFSELLAAGRTRMDILVARITAMRPERAGTFVAGRLFHRGAAMHKLRPLEVVSDEVVVSRCCNFNARAVCKCDRQFPPPKGIFYQNCC
jgi:hypothetical protein